MIITITNRLSLAAVPPALRQMLIEKLEFPNPKWLENERMGRWNRGTPPRLKFYGKAGSDGLWIPRGCLRQLILECRRTGVDYCIEDRRRRLPPVDFDFHGLLRPFQQAAVAQMLARDFGTLNAPTGSGKTVMALAMVARRRQPALIVVHTKELAAQWVERIETFLGIPPDACGLIAGGRSRIGERVTVALVQSLYKCAEEAAARTGFVVVDECHRCPSRTFTEAVTGFDSLYMLPYHDPVAEYSRMLAELTADTERNLLIAGDVAQEAAATSGVCLVLSDRKAHCENLQTLLRLRFKVESDLLTGDLAMVERQRVIERLNAGQLRVVIATGQLVGEGFDSSRLSTLFLATPIRFSGRVLQYLGRVLRPAPGKEKARVFDYVDVQVDTLVHAARARQRVYRRGSVHS